MIDNNKIEFKLESSVDKNYLVVPNIQINNVIEYQLKMMQYNKIPNLIPAEADIKDDRINLYYDITHAIPICDYLKERCISKDEYKSLITSIINALINSSSFLLQDKKFVLKPDNIYIDKKDGSPYFIYLPLNYIGEENYSWQQVINFINNSSLTDNLLELSQKVERILQESNITLSKLKYIIDEKDKLKLIEYKEEVIEQHNEEEVITKKDEPNKKLIIVLIQVLIFLIFVYLVSSGFMGGDFFKAVGVFLLFAAIDALIINTYLKKNKNIRLTLGKSKDNKKIDIKKDKYVIDKKIPETTPEEESRELKAELYKEKGDYYIVFK